MTALAIGFGLVFLMGVLHHFALRGLDWLVGEEMERRNLAIIVTFGGLLVIHTLEIVLFAGAYRLLLDGRVVGGLTGTFDRSWEGLIYFSGINFSTLGYTEIDAEGPLRMVNMMQSVGGFMLLTWSATFLYAAWRRAYRK